MPVHGGQILLQPGKLLRVLPILHIAPQHQHMHPRHLAAQCTAAKGQESPADICSAYLERLQIFAVMSVPIIAGSILKSLNKCPAARTYSGNWLAMA